MKIDFTKNLYIIFIIFENFWEAFQAILFFGLFWSFRCFPRYRNSIQIFYSSFSLSSLDASFTNLDSAFNAVRLPILHLMLVLQGQLKILSPYPFVLFIERKTRGRGFFPASSSLAWTQPFILHGTQPISLQ